MNKPKWIGVVLGPLVLSGIVVSALTAKPAGSAKPGPAAPPLPTPAPLASPVSQDVEFIGVLVLDASSSTSSTYAEDARSRYAEAVEGRSGEPGHGAMVGALVLVGERSFSPASVALAFTLPGTPPVPTRRAT